MTVERLEIWTEVGEPEDSARSRCRLGAGAGYRVSTQLLCTRLRLRGPSNLFHTTDTFNLIDLATEHNCSRGYLKYTNTNWHEA